jgi:ethanolamine utilization protein EutQ (cupin superfamily)
LNSSDFSYRAWTFAAALVVAIAMYIKVEPSIDLMRSFENARAVLRRLATRSQQSEHYLEILSDILQDVEKRQQQRAQQRMESSGRLVGRIFSLRNPVQEQRVTTDLEEPGMTRTDDLVTQELAPRVAAPLALPSPWANIDGPETFLAWDAFVFQSWDDFP